MVDGEPNSAPDSRRGRPLWPLVALFLVALVIAIGAILWLRDSPATDTGQRPAIIPPPGGAVRLGTPYAPRTAAYTTGVFIEPGDGRRPLLDEIEAARRSIDLEVYIVTDEIILSALEDAQRRGVEVRVILEEHPFGGGGGQPDIFARLEGAGIAVRWGNPAFRFTHIKTMVVDDAVAVIMNQNLTTSAFTTNRDFGVITNQPAAVRTAAAIFEADWMRGAEPDPEPLVVSPTNAREKLLDLIESANVALEVYAEVLRDPELLEAFIAAEERGVQVRVIVSPSAEFAAEREMLAAAGVDIRLMSALYVHAKMIMADGKAAYLGSQNLSATSLDLNRELGIIVDDPVSLSRLARTFDLDFRTGTPQEAP
jgi:cardiolipin synthase